VGDSMEHHASAGPVSAAFVPYSKDGPEVRLVVGDHLLAFHPEELPHVLEVLLAIERSLSLDEEDVRGYIEERRLGAGP